MEGGGGLLSRENRLCGARVGVELEVGTEGEGRGTLHSGLCSLPLIPGDPPGTLGIHTSRIPSCPLLRDSDSASCLLYLQHRP